MKVVISTHNTHTNKTLGVHSIGQLMKVVLSHINNTWFISIGIYIKRKIIMFLGFSIKVKKVCIANQVSGPPNFCI
jgi:hypothetical protein